MRCENERPWRAYLCCHGYMSRSDTGSCVIYFEVKNTNQSKQLNYPRCWLYLTYGVFDTLHTRMLTDSVADFIIWLTLKHSSNVCFILKCCTEPLVFLFFCSSEQWIGRIYIGCFSTSSCEGICSHFKLVQQNKFLIYEYIGSWNLNDNALRRHDQ